MDSKKALERRFLEEVAAICPDFPSGDVIETERPDFLISGDSRVTGIEVVSYVRGQGDGGSDHLRNEVLWGQIADEARRVFECNYSDPLMVHFAWNLNRYPRKADVPLVSASVVQAIEQHIPQTIFERARISGERYLNTTASTFIDSIHVTRMRNERQVIWASITASFISVSVDELRSVLMSKDPKVRKYLEKCDEVWLIIVADGTYISTTGETLEKEAQRAQMNSLFRRVLFYDRLNGLTTPLAS